MRCPYEVMFPSELGFSSFPGVLELHQCPNMPYAVLQINMDVDIGCRQWNRGNGDLMSFMLSFDGMPC